MRAELTRPVAQGAKTHVLEILGYLSGFSPSTAVGVGRQTRQPAPRGPEHVVWRRAAQAEVLFFDDFGGFGGFQQLEKSWWRLQVTQLLHHRERHQLTTIVTANVADWRQVHRVHESLLSRMNVPLKIALEDSTDGRPADGRPTHA